MTTAIPPAVASEDITVSLPTDVLEAMDQLAKERGRTRNQMVVAAVRRFVLAEQRWLETQAVVAAAAREAGLRTEDDIEELMDSLPDEPVWAVILRVVYDASVLVSAAAFPGSVPHQALELARLFRVQSVTSGELLDQVRRALLGPRFRRDRTTVENVIVELYGVSLVVRPTVRLAVITAKESDNRVLECAVEGEADLIVSGDRKHLLRLGSYQGIPIVAPADFLRTVTLP